MISLSNTFLSFSFQVFPCCAGCDTAPIPLVIRRQLYLWHLHFYKRDLSVDQSELRLTSTWDLTQVLTTLWEFLKPSSQSSFLLFCSWHRSTLSIRLFLKEFCILFVENCYNPLMHAVKVYLFLRFHQRSYSLNCRHRHKREFICLSDVAD